MKNRRLLWFAAITVVLGISLSVTVPTGAFQRLCQLCFDTKCVDITADAYSTCIQLTGGCIAFGECSAGLTITQ
jgi:hypothetical protein